MSQIPSITGVFEHWIASTVLHPGVALGLFVGLLFSRSNWLSPAWRACLLTLILIRLIVPLPLASAWSPWSLLPQPRWSMAAAPLPSAIPASDSNLSLTAWTLDASDALVLEADYPSEEVVATLPEPAAPAVPAPAFSWMTLMAALWASGAVLFGMREIIAYARFARWRGRLQECRDPALLRAVRLHAAETGLSRAARILLAPDLSSPAVCGLRQPCLLLPRTDYSPAELRCILLHEFIHLRRLDLWCNWLAIVARTLHWFNPLVWLMVRLYRADRELACDASVLRLLPPHQQKTYGQVLLGFLSSSPPRLSASPALTGFSHRHQEIKRRITMIKTPRSTPWRSHLVAASSILVLASAAWTIAPAQDREKPRAEGEKPRPEGEARRDGDKPRPEGEVRRDGDKPRPEGEARRDGDKPRPEGEARRDGDKPRPEGEARRDGDKPRPEGEVRRDGDKPRPEGEARRDGDKPRPEGEVRRDGDKPRVGPKDGEKARFGLKDGETPHVGPREGEKARIGPGGEMRRPVPGGPDGEFHMKVQHLNEAAENLERAGLKDEAAQYRHRVEMMVDEFRRHQAENEKRGLPGDAKDRELQELRHMVQELRGQVEHLQKELQTAREKR
ncbi:MAG: M56 family metallopeptidase [Verrucomicrobiales bacterium]